MKRELLGQVYIILAILLFVFIHPLKETYISAKDVSVQIVEDNEIHDIKEDNLYEEKPMEKTSPYYVQGLL
ncbi:hypothetical protein SAMN05661008_01896 [Alkalithermobacter thermoalcaliphilus JW-YL-7 = DSM 7308]|uniref:Uncharacterized protein n=1 Tax=Alkalithermobacter thermoalcaliphilus JW-YL-7 = DSM 7308 TaxID=1121328 RepID=A0A150FSX0_CLOPD|nr:hypothetical protein JWYL7_1779 [[Clostridium] paradoxum JW-YL-7 = DSM 7308]SHL33890.1 hypothetical protein SAMN05661008_01896 [[Clostridium] paradoxum JW-YL-7 = DSM 7308]